MKDDVTNSNRNWGGGKIAGILPISRKDKKASSIFFGLNSAPMGKFINMFPWPWSQTILVTVIMD